MRTVAVIGGGAAGMIAAIIAAREGANVFIVEKNEKLGKKLYITGKGRCNLTNACESDIFLENVITNPRFLFPAIKSFGTNDTIQFFESIGLKTKTERGRRVFPQSDHASDVILALQNELKRQKVSIRLSSKVEKILCADQSVKGILLENHTKLSADACILATGGLSYPSTGSTGDGYYIAKQLGHTITNLYPSLVGIYVKEAWIAQLEGLSLKNVGLKVVVEEVYETTKGTKQKRLIPNKVFYEDFGELLFTRFGVSGPVILSASSYLAPYLSKASFSIHLDLKPALTLEQLNLRILRDFEQEKNKHFKNALDNLLPQKIIRVIIERSMISSDRKVNQITRKEREHLAELLKDFSMQIKELAGYSQAVITKGGIAVKEVVPATMESKQIKGLYFAGEILDLDALTGGFNLQIAWSSGYLAGRQAARGNQEWKD